MLHPIHTFIHRIGRLVLLDRAADPAADGEIQRNASHVKVYSGGAVRNLSDVGTAPSHSHASHTGIGTGDHHAQLHAAAHQPGGGDAMAVDAAAATGSLRTLGTGAAQAAQGNHTHAETSAQASVATSETTTSTSYTDLATAGPAVTLAPGSTQNHLIWIMGEMKIAAADYAIMSATIAGAAADDNNAVISRETNGNTHTKLTLATSVANGSTHTAKYRSNGGNTATFERRRIVATTTG